MRSKILSSIFLIAFSGPLAAEVSKEEFARFSLQKGIKPDQNLSSREWNAFLDKLVTLSKKSKATEPAAVWDKVQQDKKVTISSGMSREAWATVFKKLNVQPEVVFIPSDPIVEVSAPAEPPVASPIPAIQASPQTMAQAAPPSTVVQPASTGSPVIAEKPAAIEAPPAKKISLDVREMEIVEVLKLVSRQFGINIVIGKGVSGRVTVFLKDADLWDALRTILETRDLAYAKDRDLIRVITASDYEKLYGMSFSNQTLLKTFDLKHVKAQTAKDMLEPFKSRVGTILVNEGSNSLVVQDTPEQLRQLEDMLARVDIPAETRVFILSHGTVDEILPKVTPLVSREFGNIQSDRRSNSIVVTDNPTRITEIAKIIGTFDSKNKSVLIEAKMVQVLLKDEYQWGINWERAFRYQRDADSAYSGVAVANTQVVPLLSVQPPTGGKITAPGISANIMSLSGLQIAGAINFLESFGKTRILSSPRITALNNQEARILVGTKEAFVTRSVVNPGSPTQAPIITEQVSFIDVGVKLFVTPVIGEDGFITMRIKPEVSSVESTVRTDNGSAIPIVRLSQAETSLVVKDGVTVVIGGLIEDKKGKTRSGVPILSRIPLLGIPFRGSTDLTQKTELVIFLTPHVMTGDVQSPDVEQYLSKKEMEEPARRKKGWFR